jgi:hypothetical protein
VLPLLAYTNWSHQHLPLYRRALSLPGLATALGSLLFIMNTVQVIVDIRNRTVSDDDASTTCGNN